MEAKVVQLPSPALVAMEHARRPEREGGRGLVLSDSMWIRAPIPEPMIARKLAWQGPNFQRAFGL